MYVNLMFITNCKSKRFQYTKSTAQFILSQILRQSITSITNTSLCLFDYLYFFLCVYALKREISTSLNLSRTHQSNPFLTFISIIILPIVDHDSPLSDLALTQYLYYLSCGSF